MLVGDSPKSSTTKAIVRLTFSGAIGLEGRLGGGNAFYGVVQSAPSMLVASSFQGTFTSSNVTSAPSALQAWLTLVTGALPSAQVVIATGPDSGSGTACAVVSGCTVTMSIQWAQVGAPGRAAYNRTQTFYYQFGF